MSLTKKNSARASIDSQSITTPDTASSSKKSSIDINSALLKHSQKKVVPVSAETEAVSSKRRDSVNRNETQQSSRPTSSCSVTSDAAAREGKSILKKSRYAGTNEKEKVVVTTGRKDSKGVAIKKGGKHHRINFKEQLEDVKIIDNWKIYNGHDYAEQSCYCNVF